jgi:hypothetical protein
LRKYTELSPSTLLFLTLQFHEKDLMPTPNLLQIRLILPPLGHIISRTDGRTDGQMDRRMDGRTDGQMDGWTVGWMDGWTDGQRDGWTDK